MIKVENTNIYNIYPAIHSIRNALKSWDRSDTEYADKFIYYENGDYIGDCNIVYLKNKEEQGKFTYLKQKKDNKVVHTKHKIKNFAVDMENFEEVNVLCNSFAHGIIGLKDMELAKRLISRGGDERKFLRTIHVNVDITNTRAWWVEADTYRIGVTKNSCSTMHSILNKELGPEDFEHVTSFEEVDRLNKQIELVRYFKNRKEGVGHPLSYKREFAHLKHMLPEGYLIMANFDTNYEQLLSMYHKRKNHFFLDWEPINKWCENLPYFMEFYSAFNKKNES